MSGIPFIDLKAQQARLRDKIDVAIARVLDHGRYILGPEVGQFEEELAQFTGAGHVVSCANGTDALTLVLLSEEIGPGDGVLVPSMTFVATVEPVLLRGRDAGLCRHRPPEFHHVPRLPRGRARPGDRGRTAPAGDHPGRPLRPAGGLPRDHGVRRGTRPDRSCRRRPVHGRPSRRRAYRHHGPLHLHQLLSGEALGCYGDGGAVFTDDAESAERLRSIRYHGKGQDKYDNVRVGLNSRLDTIQAAILREKLRILDEEMEARERIAKRYSGLLDGTVETPTIPNSIRSAWAQYTIMTDQRNALQAALRSKAFLPPSTIRIHCTGSPRMAMD